MRIPTEHLRWANKEFFRQVSTLTEEQLALTLKEGEWSISDHLSHIAGALEWFRYILNRTEWTDIVSPKTPELTVALGLHVEKLGDDLVAESLKSDTEIINFEDERGAHSVVRPTVLAQAALHTTEHKVQIVDIMTLHGLPRIDLEQMDVWHSPLTK